ncbi:hypothetical protein BDN67DRAFT_982964 [Paxillus ammoniavirescens]|nr:hypothetical protein BDN67DRAFT_982964 [Paxillus ammoniavirescens]
MVNPNLCCISPGFYSIVRSYPSTSNPLIVTTAQICIFLLYEVQLCTRNVSDKEPLASGTVGNKSTWLVIRDKRTGGLTIHGPSPPVEDLLGEDMVDCDPHKARGELIEEALWDNLEHRKKQCDWGEQTKKDRLKQKHEAKEQASPPASSSQDTPIDIE